jgi:hypothetical protein
LLSSSEHSGVPEDSKSPTFPSVGLHPTLGQSGVATVVATSNVAVATVAPPATAIAVVVITIVVNVVTATNVVVA